MFKDNTELSYKALNIQNGGDASDTYANLHLLKDSSQREQIRANLLAYCKLDTLAMVRIFEKLKEECFAMRKPYWAISFSFGDNEDYFSINEKLFKQLMD